jgi:VIT1/CCC1 family predicted Fe2+/Mn2+ transporter
MSSILSTATLVEEAYISNDVDKSKQVHDLKASSIVKEQKEDHGGVGSEFVKSIVFGGLDGVITTFSTIAAVAGGSLNTNTVLVLGFANLIADAIAMGAGDYLSSLAEFYFLLGEEKRAADLVESGEKTQALVKAGLVQKGIKEEDADEIVKTIAKNKTFFREFILTENFSLEIPDDPLGPAKDGWMCFLSFMIFGSGPLWVYVITNSANYKNSNGNLGIAAATCAFCLFMLGFTQGSITRQSRWRAGTFMVVNGMLAGLAAYLLSWGIFAAIGSNGEEEVHTC